ncbi:MAG: Holliday junction resolvase RuvX, partial [Gammaproteobacteria bacterium]|nr:Holliday junction resolvase RuvX [Gammaproteobacteria bacterium]
MKHVVMGFDFGMGKIGVAVGQRITGTANPLTILKARDGIPNWAQLEKLIQEWQPGL